MNYKKVLRLNSEYKMLQNIKKYSIIFRTVLASLAMVLFLSGCEDTFPYNPETIPDAEVEISADVIFRPMVPADVETRASEAPEGIKYHGINTLYVFFYNEQREIVREYSGKISDFSTEISETATHDHVFFKKKVKAGRYYIFAAANLPADIANNIDSDLDIVSTIEKLRTIRLNWEDNIESDLEMFGVFHVGNGGDVAEPENEGFEPDELLTINRPTNTLHSWVRRAVSKVTIDFDGSNLKDGVTVYIKNAVLKQVADGTFLGSETKIGENNFGIFQPDSQYVLTYGSGDSFSAWPSVTNSKTFTPSDVWGASASGSFHDDDAKALPCYENMQGVFDDKSKLQDKDNDGVIDSAEFKDDVPDGTYLEVEGYYFANRDEYKSQGTITYRFMLGKNAVNDFNVMRNHHYKITMRFKGYGNDVDWHIAYKEKYLEATYPQDVNYQGYFFNTDPHYNTVLNGGHNFDNQNKITVTSYETPDGVVNQWIEPEISYSYYIHNDETDTWDADNGASWLTVNTENATDKQKTYSFVASMSDTVDAKFPTSSVGSKTAPHNLSNKTGGEMVENTANCYMVGKSGWYSIPLVYGNAITDGNPFPEAYNSSHIVNHLNKQITKPYIMDNEGIKDKPSSNFKAKLIWQDSKELIVSDEIYYDPSLFGSHGGIKFHISNIKEGNAVIALIDETAPVSKEDHVEEVDRGPAYEDLKGSTKAVWSWHIWCTRFGLDYEQDTPVINSDDETFDVLPVNLGWCSDKAIKYYKRRKCEITFKVGDNVITRTIEQYPHLLLPRGDHPYYQWGRKDPFVGSNALNKNKERWIDATHSYGTEQMYNPPTLYNNPDVFQYNVNRKNTVDCISMLVQNPDKWHNCTRQPVDESERPNGYKSGFVSSNVIYEDLWLINGVKSVYDPCPAGYEVGDGSAFSGFTYKGNNAYIGAYGFDVLEVNMPTTYYGGEEAINSQVLEFYTDFRKIQSITFPISGYRDYDAKGAVYQYPDGANPGWGFVWYNKFSDNANSIHMKFNRTNVADVANNWANRNLVIELKAQFYNTDGMAVRPVRIKND